MKQKIKLAAMILFPVVMIAIMLYYASTQNVAMLNSKGEIANQQRNLLYFTALLSLVVVVPVFFMLVLFIWKFREGNKKSRYRPNWDHNKLLETIWWGIPITIIGILAVITWNTTHSLDPWQPIKSDKAAVKIQVVAMQWKWLFIYPEHGIASLDYFQMPVDTPVNFQITSDAPMNSFWIPSLGGQIYAMSGMSTQLNLMANAAGQYRGSSANISGQGFADMDFLAEAVPLSEFENWINEVKKSGMNLDQTTYETLAKPGSYSTYTLFTVSDTGLYDNVINKYMHSGHDMESSEEYEVSHAR